MELVLSEVPIDIAGGVSRIGDREIWEEIVHDYIQVVEGLMTEVESAIEREDSVKLRQDAHAIKGSSLELMVHHMSRLAAELEQLGKDGKLEGSADLFRELRTEFSSVREFLRQNSIG